MRECRHVWINTRPNIWIGTSPGNWICCGGFRIIDPNDHRTSVSLTFVCEHPLKILKCSYLMRYSVVFYFSFGSTAKFRPWPPPWNFVLLQLLDLGQSVGHLRRVIRSSQGLYVYTNTEKPTHNTNNEQPCPEWDSNPRSLRPRKWRQFMPQIARLPWPAQRGVFSWKLTDIYEENILIFRAEY
jgi:hypothetical protein